MSISRQTQIQHTITDGIMSPGVVANETATLSESAYEIAPQVIGTSWEAVTKGDVITAQTFFVQNSDVSYSVQLATANDDSGIFSKLNPGRFAFWPLEPTTATVYAKAATTACTIRKIISGVEA